MAKPRGRPRQHIGKHRPNRIRELRDGQHLSQDELGARCAPPLPGMKISRLERRVEPLTLDLIFRLADALQVHRIEIFEELPFSPREIAMVELVRGLAEADQRAAFRMLHGMAEPSDQPNDANPAATPKVSNG